MNFEIKKSSKGLCKILMAMALVCGVSITNCTNAYGENLPKDKDSANEQYVLTIEERGGIKEYIYGSSINFNSNNYDDTLLRKNIANLSCFDESKIIESKNPKIEYTNGSYVVRKEIYGNRVNKQSFYDNITKCIKGNVKEINLDNINCYEDPSFTTTSAQVVQALNSANKYVSANITYNYGGMQDKVDSSLISKWITIDDSYNIYFDESKVRDYVENMSNNYTNELGRTIQVSGGYSGNNHGWVLDSDTESNALISHIKNGETTTKSPAFSETSTLSYLKNVGSTFVEADLAKQYLWFYKNGYIVAEGNLVSGNLSTGCATPAGCYSVNNKQTNTDLIGPNYVSRVTYWMPFIGNSIGLHDASWRSEFGGEIYKTNGSHGCVNLPYSVASKIFENISVGTPVICHY